jgi:magnesium-transporting ATPase (P-type)
VGILESLREPLQLLLIGVGVLSIIWGEVRDGVAIVVIILAVASIKTWSERRARRALDAFHTIAVLARRFVHKFVHKPVADTGPRQ